MPWRPAACGCGGCYACLLRCTSRSRAASSVTAGRGAPGPYGLAPHAADVVCIGALRAARPSCLISSHTHTERQGSAALFLPLTQAVSIVLQ